MFNIKITPFHFLRVLSCLAATYFFLNTTSGIAASPDGTSEGANFLPPHSLHRSASLLHKPSSHLHQTRNRSKSFRYKKARPLSATHQDFSKHDRSREAVYGNDTPVQQPPTHKEEPSIVSEATPQIIDMDQEQRIIFGTTRPIALCDKKVSTAIEALIDERSAWLEANLLKPYDAFLRMFHENLPLLERNDERTYDGRIAHNPKQHQNVVEKDPTLQKFDDIFLIPPGYQNDKDGLPQAGSFLTHPASYSTVSPNLPQSQAVRETAPLINLILTLSHFCNRNVSGQSDIGHTILDGELHRNVSAALENNHVPFDEPLGETALLFIHYLVQAGIDIRVLFVSPEQELQADLFSSIVAAHNNTLILPLCSKLEKSVTWKRGPLRGLAQITLGYNICTIFAEVLTSEHVGSACTPQQNDLSFTQDFAHELLCDAMDLADQAKWGLQEFSHHIVTMYHLLFENPIITPDGDNHYLNITSNETILSIFAQELPPESDVMVQFSRALRSLPTPEYTRTLSEFNAQALEMWTPGAHIASPLHGAEHVLKSILVCAQSKIESSEHTRFLKTLRFPHTLQIRWEQRSIIPQIIPYNGLMCVPYFNAKQSTLTILIPKPETLKGDISNHDLSIVIHSIFALNQSELRDVSCFSNEVIHPSYTTVLAEQQTMLKGHVYFTRKQNGLSYKLA